VTTNRVITANSIEQIVNSYDNSIRYMDKCIDAIIASFEKEKAIVFYQSDHGESLGEDDTYLHANDKPEVKNPAAFIWYSDSYAEANPEKIKKLIANKAKRYRTDYLFYSILYAAGIEVEGDNEEVNIFR
jgi:glucan phosphoethanolaminetransferase (alkaline phosphatase superfamily)